MSEFSRLDAQLQDANSGIRVEDITPLVEHYIDHLSLHPVTHQQYTHSQIIRILCRHPSIEWKPTEFMRLYMEVCLLNDIIDDMRLDAIQRSSALTSIESIIKVARNAGV